MNLELHWLSHVLYKNKNFQKITIEGKNIANTLAKSGVEWKENVLNVVNVKSKFYNIPRLLTKISAILVSEVDKVLLNSNVES